MVKNHLIWTKRSKQQLYLIYNYISKDSPQNALKVINDIIAAVEKTIEIPEYYNPDK